MRFRIRAKRLVSKPVLAVDTGVWEDITINTGIPAPIEEAYRNGAFEFTFGRLEAGEELLYKVDGQINPDFRGANSGKVRLYDGERQAAEIQYDLVVRP